MKKKCLKFLVIIGLLTILLTTISTTQVQAVLQSNGGTSATKKIVDWLVNIRGMEATGGTLGLNETINTKGLLATTESNGLDCHMQKNTEYGAMVLLSASSYGNPSKIESGETTTGNSTGVVMKLNKELVAGGPGEQVSIWSYADSRYKHTNYKIHDENLTVVNRGDAMKQGSWHGSTDTTASTDPNYGVLLRAVGGSVFSYAPQDGSSGANASRAVIVIGEGL